MEKTFVDTAFIPAIVGEKDELHQKATDLVKTYEMMTWLTTDLVLYEVANPLARNAKPQAQKIIGDFLEADGIEIIYASPHYFGKVSPFIVSMRIKLGAWLTTSHLS
ncbi:MAG: type II toxin-antitoxin system VapC family toxin [Pyrinomonadaceae bacterium]